VTPTTKPTTAAVYVRVSTQDQNHGLQTTELKSYAARMGWAVVEYSEKASSVKVRPVFNRMMQDARERRFDVLLVWKLDRFARSVRQLTDNIELLDQCGVRFICATQGIDTDRQSLGGRLLMQILGAIAEFERGLIAERVRAGMAEAKRHGKHVGRPVPIWDRGKACEMRAAGLTWRAISEAIAIPEASVRRAVKKAA
jgi:DNA invertase Pin-like site-specific DNA recombinase